MEKVTTGFIGAGGIARAHAYAINSLKYYYDDAPEVVLHSVSSKRESSRKEFAKRFGFLKAESIDDFLNSRDVEAVFILGPNKVHFEHFRHALEMPDVKAIYLEKPVCSGREEEEKMAELALDHPEVRIQIGFQYLQTSGVRAALELWRSGELGKPIHFDVKYYHGDYLQKSYREKRVTRLTTAPDGGAMADLGSHGISLLMAFLGNDLKLYSAMQGGSFDDVPSGSDLFSSISLYEPQTGAVGTMSASRISSGSGDLVQLEIYAEKGSLRYSSLHPEMFEYYNEDTGEWVKKIAGSDYSPASTFPSVHVSPGWLRAMVHAHYLFFTGKNDGSFIPDLAHGLAVQRIVRETAEHLKNFREKI
ncbi:MAG: Gfo/Idh/MocA family oxidoreductase [Chlorobi bacterium]|nr:Gfo/Idh/MocA family oxidoreductase [Chlorobiota bacterium]